MDLKELKRLCDAVPPGPYYITHIFDGEEVVTADDGDQGQYVAVAGSRAVADFLVAARTYLPLLLEVAQAAREDRDREDLL